MPHFSDILYNGLIWHITKHTPNDMVMFQSVKVGYFVAYFLGRFLSLSEKVNVAQFCQWVRGALKMHFWKKLGIWPNKGRGGLTEAQVFVKIFQNQICLGKWPEMWWNTQYINGEAISYQFMRVLDPPIPNYSLSQPKKWNFSWKNNMLRIA